jgi:type IX secretion system PorP/SprF family membrane protein
MGLLSIGMVVPFKTFCQELPFSQFYAAPLYLNPAMLGSEQSITFGANVRRQDVNLDNPNDVIHAYAMVPFFRGGPTQNQIGGVGISAFSNRLGDFEENSFFASGAYNIPLKFDNSEVISFGLQFGYVLGRFNTADIDIQSGVQWSRFVGFDPSVSSTIPNLGDELQNSYPVINAGIMYYFNPKRSYVLFTGSAFSGLAVLNINQPDRSFIQDGSDKRHLEIRYHGGMEFFLMPKLKWTPTVIANYQNKNFQFNAGNYFSYNIARNRGIDTRVSEIVVGVWYRLKDAAIASVGFNRASWTVGFSYDFNLGFLGSDKQGFGGALEFSLAYRIIRNKELTRFSTPLI